MSNDKTAEQLRAHHDWYWEEPRDVSFAQSRIGWQAACEWMDTRAGSGEAVAWLVTDGSLFVDKAFTTKAHAERSVSDRKDGAHIEPLFTRPSATAVDADCQVLPKGWRIEVRDNGRSKGLCVFSPDGSFAIDGNTDHKSDIRQHVIDLLGAALASREGR